MRDIEDLHAAACGKGESFYKDPHSGYSVMTAFAHQKRGRCCGNGCRHCPYEHVCVPPVKVEAEPASHAFSSTTLMRNKKRAIGGKAHVRFHVLFWSGGKDSFLALLALQRSLRDALTDGEVEIVLLTTHDRATGSVTFQNHHISDVQKQAEALELDLIAVPLVGGQTSSKDGPYIDAVNEALRNHLPECGGSDDDDDEEEEEEEEEGGGGGEHGSSEEGGTGREDRSSEDTPRPSGRVAALCFGDLHLADVRKWREQTLGQQFTLAFPLFNVPYEQLRAELWAQVAAGTVVVEVSAVKEEYAGCSGEVTGIDSQPTQHFCIEKGQLFDTAFVAELPAGVDTMGENGEFNSCVTVTSLWSRLQHINEGSEWDSGSVRANFA